MKFTKNLRIVAAMIMTALLLLSCVTVIAETEAQTPDVTLCELFVDNGSSANVLTSGNNTLKARIFSNNISKTPANVKLVAATYEKNAVGAAVLSNVTISSVSAVQNGLNVVTIGSFMVNDPDKTEIKVMTLEGLASLRPLTIAGKLSNQSSEKNITALTLSYNETIGKNSESVKREINAEINSVDNIIWLETRGGGNIDSVLDVSYSLSPGATIHPIPQAGMSLAKNDTFTVTAADGTKKVYTVKLDWQEEDFFNMTMESGLNASTHYPNAVQEIRQKNWGDDNAGLIWQGSTASFADGESTIQTDSDGNNYWQYDTTKNATSNTSFKVRMAGGTTENKRKTTYSFDFNMKKMGNSWHRSYIRLGGTNTDSYKQHGVAELRIERISNDASDEGILAGDTAFNKYQLKYVYDDTNITANIATLDTGKWYNVKVVVRRNDYKDGSYDGLTEVYIDGEVKFSAPVWFASNKGNNLSTTNTGKLNEIGFFEFSRDSGASNFICAIDNITCSQTAPDQALGNKVIMVGDSISYIYTNNPTGSKQQGYGYYLNQNLIEGGEYSYSDMAQPGNCTVSFLEGTCGTQTANNPWSTIKKSIREDDYVLLVVGTNDQYHHNKHKNDTYQTNPQERYKDNLKTMVRDVEALGATPILITPHVTAELTINNDGKTLRNELLEYAGYMKEAYNELLTEGNHTVALLDLNTLMWDGLQNVISVLQKEGYSDTLSIIRNIYYAGYESNNYIKGYTTDPDYTHLNETGAKYAAYLLVHEMKSNPTTYYGLGKYFNEISLSEVLSLQ